MSTASPLVGFLAGAAVVGGAWLLLGTGVSNEVPHAADDPLAGIAPTADVDARLARMERRLDEIAGALDRRAADASPGPGLTVRGTESAGEATATSGGAPAEQPVITDEVLDKTIERMRDRRFAKMSSQQMRAEAHRQIRQVKDLNAARDILERLLERDLESDERGQVLTDLGSVHRSLQDFEASEKILRDAMRTAGMDSETGIKAGYHLVWTHSAAGEPAKGLAMADELLANRSAPDTFKPWLRWAGARMALDSGDHERAIRDYRQLMADVKDDQRYKQIVRDTADKLKRLDQGPR